MYTSREISNKRNGRRQIHRSDSHQGADSIAIDVSLLSDFQEQNFKIGNH